MSDDIQSLRRQLADAEENLRLLQERKAKYVLETDIPLRLIKGERRLEAQIADLRERLGVCQEPLTQLYEQLQDAAADEEWAEVLAVGAHIRALDEGDRDVSELVELARERLQQPQRRPLPTWTRWAVAGGAILVVLLGLGLGLGSRIFGTSPAPTEPPTVEPTEWPAPRSGLAWARPADGMVMVYVQAGEFEMGSSDDQVDDTLELCSDCFDDCKREWFERELSVHTVALDGFWIDRTEVTNGQYQRCVEEGDCRLPADSRSSTRDSYYGNSTYDNYPVIYVTWHRAADYCAWAGARLPTEAEWEYAARGPEGRVFPWGDEFDGTRLNYCDPNCPPKCADETVDDGYIDTAPVDSYLSGASWCGALGMAGNVGEWVADWYGDYPSERQVNPTGPPSGEHRVLRGGSWRVTQTTARCAFRSKDRPGIFSPFNGFRCARASR